MAVLWSPGGKAGVSGAPDLSLLVVSNLERKSYGSTNGPTEFWPLQAPEAT